MPSILDGDSWDISRLTAREVFAIAKALEVAIEESDDEPFPGLIDALAKLIPVRNDVVLAGFTVHTETSAQSQAYIDGAGPWFEHDDDPSDDDDEGCPKSDPDRLSRSDECHDACESQGEADFETARYENSEQWWMPRAKPEAVDHDEQDRRAASEERIANHFNER